MMDLGSKGHLFAVAASNDALDNDVPSVDRSYPASYNTPFQVTVAALDSSGSLASFSNYGNVSTHIAAPGVGILSTVPGNSYASYSGTSMATPHVAGSLLLMRAASNGTLSNAVLRELLLSSATKVPALTSYVGSGSKLNLSAAVAAASDRAAAPSPPQSPPPGPPPPATLGTLPCVPS